MKLIWKSTKAQNNKQSIKPISNQLQLIQQYQEWSWLERKLSNHFETTKGLNINQRME